MYRLLDDLGPFPGGEILRKGTLQSLSQLSPKALGILLEKGCVVIWMAPPLDVLPGWERKAEVFAEVGITTVSELLEADTVQLLERLEISEAALQQCLTEVQVWVR